jgi:hypothetical protein
MGTHRGDLPEVTLADAAAGGQGVPGPGGPAAGCET